MIENDLMIFPGTASANLTSSICDWLKVPVRKNDCLTFSDGNTFVQVGENVRGRDVFVVQSTIHKTNDKFMELLFWIDALKRASAASVTAVIPYFSYGKGDKKDEPRVSIRARVCADALESVGCDRVVTMDLHSPQIQGFFRIPVDNLFGLHTLGNRVKKDGAENLVVVAADTGFAEEARKFARYLDAPVAISVKHRPDHNEQAEVIDIIGDVRGKTALIVDDFVISGGTLIEDARDLKSKGASRVMAAVTHGVFSPGAMKRISDSELEKLYVTDSVENRPEPLIEKIQVVPVASCFGEAIKRIARKESISAMFPE
ncbi:MAG: ribose-phosphate pyrophosphokinase [Spirochaetes bacterium]|nr:MAG: ribose-phosphate pyrophosphokinase [Spirochaetota bacterium]